MMLYFINTIVINETIELTINRQRMIQKKMLEEWGGGSNTKPYQ